MGRHIRVVAIDDHPVIPVGVAAMATDLSLVAAYPSVEAFLGDDAPQHDAVLLDLNLTRPGQPQGDAAPLTGTAAIRALLEAGTRTVVVYTALATDMVLAGCLAAGAAGAVTKNAPASALVEVLEAAVAGRIWVDPAGAGALVALARGRHVGALSPQQAAALRLRAQGLKQQAIAARIGVKDEETVHRYLRSAVDKLTDYDAVGDIRRDERHPGSLADEVARQSGLVGDLVRWEDIEAHRLRTRRRR